MRHLARLFVLVRWLLFSQSFLLLLFLSLLLSLPLLLLLLLLLSLLSLWLWRENDGTRSFLLVLLDGDEAEVKKKNYFLQTEEILEVVVVFKILTDLGMFVSKTVRKKIFF